MQKQRKTPLDDQRERCLIKGDMLKRGRGIERGWRCVMLPVFKDSDPHTCREKQRTHLGAYIVERCRAVQVVQALAQRGDQPLQHCGARYLVQGDREPSRAVDRHGQRFDFDVRAIRSPEHAGIAGMVGARELERMLEARLSLLIGVIEAEWSVRKRRL
jgi:hypothetical protein